MITTPILVMSGVLVVFIVAVLIVGVAALAAMIAVALCVAFVRIVQFSTRRVSGFAPKNSSSDGFRGVSFVVHPLTAAQTKAPAWLKQKTHSGIK